MIDSEGIRATGLYLLEVLKQEKTVAYSRFYNADPATEETLVRGAVPFMSEVIEHEAEDDLREEAHVMLDFAAWQLEDLGIVKITLLKSLLIDDEPDFQITLTEKGERLASEGLTYGFHDPEYSIIATPASEWLIELLDAAGDGTVNLQQVMESADTDGEVIISDDCDNNYGLGTGSFAWAFEVALWHHAKRGVIVAECRSTEDEKVWSDFVNRSDRPFRPRPLESQPLWDIPFRLADLGGEAERKIVHVGTVG